MALALLNDIIDNVHPRNHRIYEWMKDANPSEEFEVMDVTGRWLAEPRLVGDTALLSQSPDEKCLSKNQRLYGLGVGETELASNAKRKAGRAQIGRESCTKISIAGCFAFATPR